MTCTIENIIIKNKYADKTFSNDLKNSKIGPNINYGPGIANFHFGFSKSLDSEFS